MRRCPTHGLAGTLATNGVDLVRRIGAITGGTSWPLYAPLVMADARTAGSLAGDPQIQETSAQRSKVSCAIVSIGAWAPDASQVYMSLRDADATQLQAAGVCAETCALLLDATVTGCTDSTNAAWASARGTSAPFPPSLPSPPVPRRSPRRGPYCAQAWCLP